MAQSKCSFSSTSGSDTSRILWLRQCNGAKPGNKLQQNATVNGQHFVPLQTKIPHGHACSYNHAAAAFFAANSMSLSRVELAVALRNILVTGPAKTTRVPMIVGPTNSGKSTLVLPFDELHGFAHVFHKSALGSSFALRPTQGEEVPLLGRLPSS